MNHVWLSSLSASISCCQSCDLLGLFYSTDHSQRLPVALNLLLWRRRAHTLQTKCKHTKIKQMPSITLYLLAVRVKDCKSLFVRYSAPHILSAFTASGIWQLSRSDSANHCYKSKSHYFFSSCWVLSSFKVLGKSFPILATSFVLWFKILAKYWQSFSIVEEEVHKGTRFLPNIWNSWY